MSWDRFAASRDIRDIEPEHDNVRQWLMYRVRASAPTKFTTKRGERERRKIK